MKASAEHPGTKVILTPMPEYLSAENTSLEPGGIQSGDTVHVMQSILQTGYDVPVLFQKVHCAST